MCYTKRHHTRGYWLYLTRQCLGKIPQRREKFYQRGNFPSHSGTGGKRSARLPRRKLGNPLPRTKTEKIIGNSSINVLTVVIGQDQCVEEGEGGILRTVRTAMKQTVMPAAQHKLKVMLAQWSPSIYNFGLYGYLPHPCVLHHSDKRHEAKCL